MKQEIRSLEDNVLKSICPYGTIITSNPMPNTTTSNVPYWCGGNTYSTFVLTGATEYTTEPGLMVESIEITALNLIAGATIQLVVW